MTNRFSTLYLGLFDSILTDVESTFPDLGLELMRDSKRLHSASNARGDHAFTVDLPNIGKFFEHCLEHQKILSDEGFLAPNTKGLDEFEASFHSLPLNGKRNGDFSLYPRLFGGLWMKIFDSQGLLLNDADPTVIFMLRQLYNAAKKVQVECPDKALYASVKEFMDIEREVIEPTNQWSVDFFTPDSDVHLCDSITPPDIPLFPELNVSSQLNSRVRNALDLAQQISDLVSYDLGPFDPLKFQPRHGPGVVSDASKIDDKYIFPTWPMKLEQMFPMSEFAFANYDSWADWAGGYSYGPSPIDRTRGVNPQARPWKANHELPSRLIAVPKTQKAPRLIAAESTCHQWCQQATRSYLEDRLSATVLSRSINFRTQQFNREYALSASATGRFATLDLSSASDRLSLWVVERIFRKNPTLLMGLHSARSRWMVNSIDKKSPRFIKLKKFATQGSAVTFPIQTYVFSIISLACTVEARGSHSLSSISANRVAQRAFLRRIGQDVRVFGDDIIVPVEASRILTEVLQHLGLRVNTSKSFSEGNFRESCGMDAFRGYDVTPAYIRRIVEPTQPESILSFISCSNNFFKKGLWHTSEWLRLHVSSLVDLHLPIRGISSADPLLNRAVGSGLEGWSSFVGDSFKHLKRRYNDSLHRVEYRCTIFRDSTSYIPRSPELSLFRALHMMSISPQRVEPVVDFGIIKRKSPKWRKGWVASY